jgi:hypothetical protein
MFEAEERRASVLYFLLETSSPASMSLTLATSVFGALASCEDVSRGRLEEDPPPEASGESPFLCLEDIGQSLLARSFL